MTALMFAVKVGSFDVVKLLVENSANIFAQNSVSFAPNSHQSRLFSHHVTCLSGTVCPKHFAI